MPLQATSGAASYDAFGGGVPFTPTYIEEIFSTFLYQGNGSTQTITNGIDLAGKGGLVWLKRRDAVRNHGLFDTVRGATKLLYSDLANAEYTDVTSLTSFNSNGFSLGLDGGGNANGGTYASWTFREQPKFFDVVTWTGNNTSNRQIAHNLASVPGCVIFKCTSDSQDWMVYHRTQPTRRWYLNLIAGSESANNDFGSSAYNSTNIFVGDNLNISGRTYVAYVFAHNAGGFGLTGTDNVITCDALTTNGSGVFSVSLGYEPQWVLLKKATAGVAGNSDWFLLDNMRGWSNTNQVYLYPNTSGAEYNQSGSYFVPTATGFQSIQTGVLDGSSTYIYIAIRRGPMKVPTTGTSVYYPFARAGNDTQTDITGVGFTPDLWMVKSRNIAADFPFFDRLRGVTRRVASNSTFQEESFSGSNGLVSLNMDGITIGAGATDGGICNDTGTNYGNWLLKRAPGFFDEVCYTGTGSAMTVTHNLGVVPELMIVKSRSTADSWPVYSSATGNTNNLFLNQTDASASRIYWNNSTPSASVFYLGNSSVVSNSGSTYVAYLFASCPGVSKVGSYTGTGTTQTINCGFTAGSRFVLIKRTDSTGDWYVWDSARGIVAGNDPYLLLNSTAAEVTSTDYVDTAATGFEISSTAPAAINANGGTFIFLAIA